MLIFYNVFLLKKNVKYVKVPSMEVFMKFICFFVPGFISLYIDTKINKTNKFNYELIIKYFLYTFVINLLGNSAVYLISSEKNFYYMESIFTYEFIFKYMWMGLIISIILPIIFKILEENINVCILVRKKNEK